MCDESINELIVGTLYTNRERTAYYPIILSKCKKIASKQIETMGVCFDKDGGVVLLYNPEFLKKITTLEAIAVLKHEAMHIFLDHITRFKEMTDQNLVNMACDISINQYIQDLPEGGLYPETFELEKGLWAEEYYQLLKNKKQGQGGGGQNQGRGGSVLDDHSIWVKVCDANGNIIGTVEDLDIDDKQTIDTLVQNIAELIQENTDYEKLPNWIQKRIDDLKSRGSQYNWKKEFRILVQSLLSTQKRRSQKRVDRKLSCTYTDLLFPGKRKQRQPKVLIVRDTSGSVFYDEEFTQGMLDELAGISKSACAWVCDCDTKIHQIYKVKKSTDFRKMKGCGGTSFVEPFKLALKEGFNAVIYMTDLCGEFPEVEDVKHFARKTLWVVFGQNHEKVPFGKVINIDTKRVGK